LTNETEPLSVSVECLKTKRIRIIQNVTKVRQCMLGSNDQAYDGRLLQFLVNFWGRAFNLKGEWGFAFLSPLVQKLTVKTLCLTLFYTS